MPEDIITIARFDSLPSAYFAKSLLESHGIQGFLTNENATRVMMHMHMSGGIGLQIAERDLAEAREVLAAMDAETGEPASGLPGTVSEPAEAMCPQCGGTRCEPSWSPGLAVLSVLLLGLPLIFLAGRRKCGFCGTIFRPST